MRTPQRKKTPASAARSFPIPSLTIPHLRRMHLAAGLIVCVIGAIGFAAIGRPGNAPVNAVAAVNSGSEISTAPNLVSVVVARKPMQTGDAFDADAVSTVSQAADRVPADAIKSLHELEGRVAIGPISAMSTVTRSSVGNSVAVLPTSLNQGESATVESLLAALGSRLRRVTVNLSTDAPLRGSRVALVFTASSGKQSLATKQGWVVSSDGKKAVILVAPEDASVLRTFPPEAVFSTALLRETESAEDVVKAVPVQSAAEAG